MPPFLMPLAYFQVICNICQSKHRRRVGAARIYLARHAHFVKPVPSIDDITKEGGGGRKDRVDSSPQEPTPAQVVGCVWQLHSMQHATDALHPVDCTGVVCHAPQRPLSSKITGAAVLSRQHRVLAVYDR